ncbi:MAG: protein translocase subunit SecD [Alphaproteobacteria bacterium]|nr:protein translocase subunit SecD [Alphaproteobacteria bacterium]
MLDFPNWKRILVAVVCLFGVLYAAPNFMPDDVLEGVPDWSPGKRISLGLDLQGGAHLLMQVDTEGYLKEILDRGYKQDIRAAMRTAKVRPNASVVGNAVIYQFKESDKEDAIRREIRRNSPDLEVESLGDGKFRATLSEQGLRDRIATVMSQSIEVIRRRIDEMGTREPIIQRQGEDRILLQVPGVRDTERLKGIINQTAKLTFHMVDMNCDPNGRPPPGSKIFPSDELGPDGKPFNHCIRKRVRLSGERLVDAQPTFQDNQPVVSFRFDTRGARLFCKTTQDNVGRLFAVVLDGKVITAPRIEEPICGGSGIIRGSFTVQSARDLAILLRAGALPADMKILEERSVGPGLGQDSIDAGKMASIIGMVLVVIFMVIAYGMFGAMAVVALFFNISLILGLLSILQATLTLPGIAGIVLTMGMAVDANVLIFERIREEVHAGRSPLNAVDAGYRRALTTIIDSNLTTLIATTLLFAFGSGPIKGFAITLSIGILTSMFTAIMVTRLQVILWLRRSRPTMLPI